MTSKNTYIQFVKGLNYGHHRDVMNIDDLIFHLSLESRVMSPKDAKETIQSLVKEGAISRNGNMVDLRNLYDPSQNRYIMKSGKTGRTLKSRPGTTGARTVRYVGPGHTQIGYAHRVLDIHFKETKEEYDRKRHLRRVHGARKGAKKRSESDQPIFVERNDDGTVLFVTKTGKNATTSARRKSEKGSNQIIRNKLKKDAYSIEDMRALLKDEHWEEVVNSKRWMTDNKELVKQFNRYLKRKNKR